MIIDAYAWIEYFCGSKEGQKVDAIIRKKECYTLECNLSEIYDWTIKAKQDFAFALKIIAAQSKILPINRANWIRGTEIKIEQRKKHKDFGLIDALMLAKQEEMKCKIISGDKHFKHIKNVVYLS